MMDTTAGNMEVDGDEAVRTEELITICFHGKIEPKQVPTNGKDDLTCEAVLQVCLKHVQGKMWGSDIDRQINGPKYLPTFGLVVCPDELIWIPLNHVFKKSTEKPRNYKFRVRFRPPVDQFNDSIMCEYLFLQILDDFLLGPIGKDERLESNPLFALLVIALMFPKTLPFNSTAVVDEKFKSPHFNFWNFTKLFSKEIAKKFITQPIVDHYWVHKEIKSRIHEYKSHQPQAPLGFYAKSFYKLLIEVIPNYCFEMYSATVQTSTENEKVTVTVGLFKDSKTQIALFYGEEFQCSLQDIYNMSLKKPNDFIDRKWRVEIDVRTGPPKFLEFEEERTAESFVTMIQGYINLYVRYDTCFCKQLQTAGSRISNELKSFGPLGQHTVASFLEDSKSSTDFNKGRFLIHESLTHFGQYDVCWSKGKQNEGQINGIQAKKNQKSGTIEYLEGIPQPQFRLKLGKKEATFENSLQLRRHLNEEFGQQIMPIDFQRVADINEEFQLEIDCYAYNINYEDCHKKTSLAFPVIKEDLTERNPIPDKNPLIKKYEVYFQTEKMMLVELQSEDGAHAKSFREGLVKLYKLNHISPGHFLKFHSLLLDAQFAALMEYAPQPDLLTYIKSNRQTVAQKVNIMDQIITILSIMDKAQIFHGNLRLRNFMVFPSQDAGFVTIKLGDPGISSYFDTLPLENPNNVERSPWLSPKRQTNLKEITCQSEVYAVGTTLCELLYETDQFHEELKLGSDQTILTYLNENNHLPCPPFLADNYEESTSDDPEGNALSPEAREVFQMVWRCIQSCWTEDSTDRSTIPDLLNSMKEIKKKTEVIEGDTIFEKMKEVLKAIGVKQEELKTGRNEKNLNDLNKMFNMCWKEKNLHYSCINMKDYIEELGKGNFGTVWKGYIRAPQKVLPSQPGVGGARSQQNESSTFNTTIAAKMIKKVPGSNIQSLYKEVITVCRLDHPNIVKCLYLSNNVKKNIINGVNYHPLMLIMEYMNEGNLSRYAKNMGDLSTPELVAGMLKIMLDIAEGMVYLSGLSIVHRDLAARNILLCKGDDGVVTAKVSDLGLARLMEENYRFYKLNPYDFLPCFWMPPECLVFDPQSGKFSSPGDVWSFGTVMWEAFSKGDTPRNKLKALLKPVTFGKSIPEQLQDLYSTGWRLKQNNSMNEDVYDLMKLCWQMDPQKRPPFVELVQKLKQLLKDTSAKK